MSVIARDFQAASELYIKGLALSFAGVASFLPPENAVLSRGSIRLTAASTILVKGLASKADLWAATNIPAGQDMSFAGDANLNGIPNGVEYAFAGMEIEHPEPGASTAPPLPVPSDVRLIRTYSTDLLEWVPTVTWDPGVAPFIQYPDDITIEGGQVIDTYRDPSGRGYWRYEAELIAP